MRIRSGTVLIALTLIVCFWAALPIAAYYNLPDWASRGQFGDVFGAVNALFSGLAFAGLIVAILLQREDLALQREELTLTRKELARSAEAQVQSEAALRSQAEAARRSSRLATINFLLDHYRHELAQLRGTAYMQNDPRVLKVRDLEEKEAALLSQIERLYVEVIPHEQPPNTAQGR